MGGGKPLLFVKPSAKLMSNRSSRFDPVSDGQQSKIGVAHHNTQIGELFDKLDMHRAMLTRNAQEGAISGTFDVLLVQNVGFASKNFVDSNRFGVCVCGPSAQM